MFPNSETTQRHLLEFLTTVVFH